MTIARNLVLTAASPTSTATLLVTITGSFKLLCALADPREELSWTHIAMLLLMRVKTTVVMIDRLQHVTVRVRVHFMAIVSPSSTHVSVVVIVTVIPIPTTLRPSVVKLLMGLMVVSLKLF